MIRTIKNIIGTIFNYGNCPNCKDNFWWKGRIEVPYEESPSRASVFPLCGECYENPEMLNAEDIERYLVDSYLWPEDGASKVAGFIPDFKKGKRISHYIHQV